MFTVLLPPGINPIAVNRYINIKTSINMCEWHYNESLSNEEWLGGLDQAQKRTRTLFFENGDAFSDKKKVMKCLGKLGDY